MSTYISLFIVTLLSAVNFSYAQSTIELKGAIIEEETSQAIPYATIAIKELTTNEYITGMISDSDGKFTVATST